MAPLEAGQGIWLAATRVSQPGGPEQAMTMPGVLRGYTSWPAYASFEEHRKGTLVPGMLADIVILGSDLLSKPPAKPTDVVVETTIFDGKVVYERGRP